MKRAVVACACGCRKRFAKRSNNHKFFNPKHAERWWNGARKVGARALAGKGA